MSAVNVTWHYTSFVSYQCHMSHMKVSIVGSLRDREVTCSASDRQGSNFEFCVWRTVSSLSSHHPQEVLLAQFSLYVHKGGLKPDSFHFHMSHMLYIFYICAFFLQGVGSGAVVKAACLKSRRSRLRAPLWPSKKLPRKNVSSPLTRKSLILWGASVTGRYRARPLMTRGRIVSVESCVWSAVSSHHPELSLACMCTKLA